MAVGRNFHFGYNRESGITALSDISPGIHLNVVDPVSYNGEIVSSTRIRTLIQQGMFSDVTVMLGSMYQLDLREKGGISIQGRKGEVDLNTSGQVIPGDGDYAAFLVTEQGDIPCDLAIRNGKACWNILEKTKAAYTKIKYITFIKRS